MLLAKCDKKRFLVAECWRIEVANIEVEKDKVLLILEEDISSPATSLAFACPVLGKCICSSVQEDNKKAINNLHILIGKLYLGKISNRTTMKYYTIIKIDVLSDDESFLLLEIELTFLMQKML